jgi:hypothetical protein
MVNNDTMFFNSLRDYSSAFAYSTANSAQFRDYIGQRLGLDLYEFIDQWIFGALYPEYDITWAESQNNILYLRINQTQTVRDHFTMPVRFFAYHGASVDTLNFDNTIRSQGFQKSLSYMIDSLKLDDDALLLSRNSTGITIYKDSMHSNDTTIEGIKIYKDSIHKADTTISKLFLRPRLTYSPNLIPSSVPSETEASSHLTLYQDKTEILCKFAASNDNATIELYNSVGMKILTAVISGGETTKRIDIRNLSSGVYFLRYINRSVNEIRSINITR